jgi:exportin-7
LQIFQISLSSLRQIMAKSGTISESKQPEEKLKEHGLTLALSCLSFDFIGTAPDESAADYGTVQAPANWRAILQDPATLRLFADLYASSTPPQSTVAMACLVQMASVRRTLFNSEEERKQFLANLMMVMIDILRHKRGLSVLANHHEFCRLLARLKGNYQLSQIVEVEGYAEWITLVADFTCSTFKAWQVASNSMYYLLGMWSRLISSMHYLKADRTVYDLLNSVIPAVIETYVTARLESVPMLQGTSEEDPLMDTEQLHEHLESLPFLGRCNYPKNSSFIVSRFDPLALALQVNI